VCKADNLLPSSADVTESGSLKLPEPSGSHRPVMGTFYVRLYTCFTPILHGHANQNMTSVSLTLCPSTNSHSQHSVSMSAGYETCKKDTKLECLTTVGQHFALQSEK
jgi:hypothetical protein